MTTKRVGKVKVLKWSVRNNRGAGHKGAGASPQHKGGTLTPHFQAAEPILLAAIILS